MSGQEQILDKGDLSQMFALNAEPDETQAQYIQQHQKDTDFNYAMKGDSGDVGRIVTNASQEHRSEAAQAKKKEKENANLRHLLDQQELLGELNQLLGDMNGILDDIEEMNRRIQAGRDAINSDDPAEMKRYLIEQEGYDPEDLEDKSKEELAQIIEDKIDDDTLTRDKLKEEYNKIHQEYVDEANNIDDPDLKEKYLAKLRELDERAENDGVDVDDVFQEVRKDRGYTSSLFEAKDGGSEGSIQNDNSAKLTEEVTEVVKTDEDINEQPTYESAFPEMEDVLTSSFNAASSGETSSEIDLDKALEGEGLDSELAAIEPLEKPPGLG